MHRLWSDTLRRLSPYTPGELARNSDVIKLNTNEHALSPSSRAVSAGQKLDIECLRQYPDPTARLLTEAIARADNVSPDQVLVTNGSDEVLAFAWTAFLSDTDTVPAIPAMTYTFYPVWAKLLGQGLHRISMQSDLSIDVEALTAWDGPVVFPNPNAPTGLSLPIEVIEGLVAHDPNRLVLIDEAYSGFGATSAVSLINQYDNLLITRSFSKSHALAGLRVGYGLAHANLIEGLRRVKDSFNSYPVDAYAQCVATAAISDSAWIAEASATVRENRTELVAGLTQLDFSVLPSQANFVLASHPEHTGIVLTEYLKTQNILVRSWSSDDLLPWVRITVGTKNQQARLLSVLAEYLND
ncbi:MAG: histidinol-phosphate transaminase [Pseudomonadota bacterium]|nr:histidinol-phosphate transaminase [Pseudomonadota bacterium]